MKASRFRKVGRIYIPRSWQEGIISILFIIFCVHIFIFIDGRSHSISDTLHGIFPYIYGDTMKIGIFLGGFSGCRSYTDDFGYTKYEHQRRNLGFQNKSV